jgi:hypothetical protein
MIKGIKVAVRNKNNLQSMIYTVSYADLPSSPEANRNNLNSSKVLQKDQVQ